MAGRTKVYSINRKRKADLKIQRLIVPLLIAVVALIWISEPTLNLFRERAANKQLKLDLQKQLSANKDLRTDIKKLNQNTHIELKARKDLGLVKKGEIPYYVLVKKIKPKARPKARPKEWWQQTLDFIEGIFAK